MFWQLSPSYILPVILVMLVIAWMIIYWRASSARAKQYLLWSVPLGAILTGLLFQSLSFHRLRIFSLLDGNFHWAATIVVGGLLWSMLATLAKVLPWDRHFPQPVSPSWAPFLGSMLGLVLVVTVASELNLSPTLMVAAYLAALAFVFNRQHIGRLLSGVITGLVVAGLFFVLSIVLASLWLPEIRQGQIINGIYFGSHWQTYIFSFIAGLAVPGLTARWLGQPQTSSKVA